MRKILSAVCVSIILCGCSHLPHMGKSNEVALFNGKNMHGWKLVKPNISDAWKVVGKVDTQNTIVPTSCKMNRPS